MREENVEFGKQDLEMNTLEQSPKSNNGSSQHHRNIKQRVTLSWRNIHVYATKETFYNWIRCKQSSEAHLIRDVSGEAKCGRILAILGTSGAGKTTLLNILSGRNVDDCRVEGLLAINGQETDRKTIKSLSAIVQQNDIFLCNLTVREHIYYQALLRMRGEHNDKQIRDRTNELINELELTQCMDLYIGNLRQKGISGGEKKRLSLASEILGSPSLLFLDEPTSGLDLHVAEKIIALLRKLSVAGETIVCTIHQPSSEIFRQFDDLLLLAEGRVAFMGKAIDALTFFEELGYKVPVDFNPGDSYIETLAIDSEDIDNSRKKVNNICDAFQQSKFVGKVEIDSSKPLIIRTKYKSSFWTQFNVFARRSWKNNWRENMYSVILVQDFIAAFVFALPYYGQPLNQTGVKNINSAIFFLVIMLLFQLCLVEIRLFYEELPLYKRELDSGIFSVTASFWGYNVAHIPYQLLIAFIFMGIYYIVVGFGGGLTAFINYAVTCLLLSQTVMSFVYTIRNCLLPIILSIKVTSTLLRMMFLLSGTMIDYSTLPKFIEYLKSVLFTYLANEALIINQWHKVGNISCDVLRITRNAVITTKLTDFECANNGTKVIQSFNYDTANFEIDNAKLLLLLILYRVIANIILCLRMKRF